MKSISKEKRKEVNNLIEILKKAFGCDITKKCRVAHYVMARAMAYVLIRKFLGLSYEQIGGLFNKHHATVMHAITQWPYMMKFNKELEVLYAEVYSSWVNSGASKPYVDCEQQVINLHEQINFLTLQLVQANEALKAEQENQTIVMRLYEECKYNANKQLTPSLGNMD
tara:strand:- start:321 stop:824 length:504 start_codon:yes stop_codon:yes gene_type:complete